MNVTCKDDVRSHSSSSSRIPKFLLAISFIKFSCLSCFDPIKFPLLIFLLFTEHTHFSCLVKQKKNLWISYACRVELVSESTYWKISIQHVATGDVPRPFIHELDFITPKHDFYSTIVHLDSINFPNKYPFFILYVRRRS